MFDLTIFPLFLAAGREQYELPGLYACVAPRKAARTHAQDLLVLFWRLSTPTGAPANALTRAQQQEILTRLSETYFATPGSVTAGLRAVVTRLNDFLLSRNLRPGPEGQLIGTLNLAVLRGQTLILAHAGPAHSFVLGKGQVQHYDDSTILREGAGGRGLGMARQATPRFYQVLLEAGDMLVICSDPPASWTSKTLAGSPQLSLDHLRRRLLSEAVNDLQAAVIRVQPGKGQVTYWKPSDRPAQGERPAQADRAASSERRSTPVNDRQTSTLPPDQKQAAIAPASPEKTVSSQPPVSAPVSEPKPSVAGPLMSEPARPATPPRPAQPAEEPPPAAESTEALTGGTVPAENAPLAVQPVESSPAPDQASTEETASEPAPEESTSATAPPAPVVFLGEPAASPEGKATAEPISRPVPRPPRRTDASVGVSPVPGPAVNGPAQSPSQERKPGPQKPAGGAGKGWFGWMQSKRGSNPTPTAQKGSPANAAAISGETGKEDPRRAPAKPAAPVPLAVPRSERLRRWLFHAFRGGRSAKAKVDGVISNTAAKVAPGKSLGSLPQSWLLLVAIAVPLVVVAVATTVYVRAGRSEQFALLYEQARQYASQAAQLTDPLQQKEAWTRAFDLSNQALARYDHTSQPARELRQQALGQLDTLDGIARLDYQPLRDGLGSDVKITKMVSTLTGVYMLDANQGRIFRLQPITTGYSIDPQFNCGPGKAGSSIITKLIDLAPLPINNDLRADIMGIDTGGNLVYCSANLEGFDSKPLTPPDSGWGQITAITTLGDALFVLDPKGNAVYRYDGINGVFANGPHLYFDNDIPHMNDVVDMDVDPEFLYMLHASGEMTVCDSGGVSYAPVKCADPAPYGDARIGYDPSPLTFPSAHFTSIQTTQPPAASLYALDDANRAIYHLSLRKLNLQRQFRPQIETDFPLPTTPATGFVITLNRRAIIAFDNQIYFALIP